MFKKIKTRVLNYYYYIIIIHGVLYLKYLLLNIVRNMYEKFVQDPQRFINYFIL